MWVLLLFMEAVVVGVADVIATKYISKDIEPSEAMLVSVC